MKLEVKAVNLGDSLFISGNSYGTKVNKDNSANQSLQMFYDTEEKGLWIIKNHTEATLVPNGSYHNMILKTGLDLANYKPEYKDCFKLSTERIKIKTQESVAPPLQINAQVWDPTSGIAMEQPALKTEPRPKRKVLVQVEGEK